MGKFGRTWEMMKSSARVLRKDKEMIVFPVMSGIFTVLLVASFILPMLGDNALGRQLRSEEGLPPEYFYGGLFLFYVLSYFIVVFFNSAVIACALERMDGGDPTVRSGLSAAFDRFAQILGWALFAGTVGFILRVIEERSEMAGRIIAGLLGVAWSVTAYLAVPALVAQRLGPIDAFRESARLLKQSWGEQIIGNLGFGLVFFLLMLPAVAIVALGGSVGSGAALAVSIGLAIAYGALLAVIQSALQAIYQAAVYRYASTGQAPTEFDAHALAGSIRPR